jgi:hypothetical protein
LSLLGIRSAHNANDRALNVSSRMTMNGDGMAENVNRGMYS